MLSSDAGHESVRVREEEGGGNVADRSCPAECHGGRAATAKTGTFQSEDL